MHFGPRPIATAAGTILAHSVVAAGQRFKKGRVLSDADTAALTRAGVEVVTVASLEPGDLGEDLAAARIARAAAGAGLSPTGAFTGRSNLIAETRGVLVVDRARIDTANLADEAITLATLPPWEMVGPRDLVATVKIIPYGVPEATVAAVEAILARGTQASLHVAPLRGRAVALVHTTTPGFKPALVPAMRAVTQARLTALDSTLCAEHVVEHEVGAVATALARCGDSAAEVILVAGASAILDRRDVVPAAVERAGGTIVHCGMPVDPGNLLLLAELAGRVVLGLPGCARSAKLNGFDWVLHRVLCDVAVTRADIMRMGCGGLLKEIPSRPLPRADAPAQAPSSVLRGTRETPRAPAIAAVVLAAGQARRMGHNKLIAPIDGRPMLHRVVETVRAARLDPVVVVTGPEGDRNAEATRAVLADLPVRVVACADAAAGLSASLRAGVSALPEGIDGCLVVLADMPFVAVETIRTLVAAFAPIEGRAVCIPLHAGQRGNPRLWARRHFAAMVQLDGDRGAGGLLDALADEVCEVAVSDQGVLRDLDTPEALAAAQAKTS